MTIPGGKCVWDAVGDEKEISLVDSRHEREVFVVVSDELTLELEFMEGN